MPPLDQNDENIFPLFCITEILISVLDGVMVISKAQQANMLN